MDKGEEEIYLRHQTRQAPIWIHAWLEKLGDVHCFIDVTIWNMSCIRSEKIHFETTAVYVVREVERRHLAQTCVRSGYWTRTDRTEYVSGIGLEILHSQPSNVLKISKAK